MTLDIVGIYFDFFGTLIDSRHTLTNIWSKIAKRLGMEINPDDPRILAGMQKQEEEANKIEKPYINFSREEWKALNFYVLDTMGVKSEGSSEIISEVFNENYFKECRLYPGCRETLKQIKSKKIKIGLLTHGNRELKQTGMQELKILEFFDIFIHSFEYGYNKSQIEIYQIALEAMGTNDPKKILHVGDDMDLDFNMAQKIGMIPILFDPYNKCSLNDIRVIRELPEVLKFL